MNNLIRIVSISVFLYMPIASAQESPMYFGASFGDKISLYDNRLGQTYMYGYGIEGGALYARAGSMHRWYIASQADNGTSDAMELYSGGLKVNGRLTLEASDPYVKVNTDNKHLVLSGGTGWNNTGAVILLKGKDSSSSPSTMTFLTVEGTAMFIGKNRNVGIGTSSPNNKLDVKGTIRAEEVIVETGWSDFVFEDGYKLPSLHDVESHIEEFGHLPDVPSAKTVEAEGLSIGEAQKIMMQKIEELTLYVIEQDKKINELENWKAQQLKGAKQ